MVKYLTEKAIYKKVGTSDFTVLTPAQVEAFVANLHRIEPGVSKGLMNQFADFRMTANRMVGFLRIRLNKKRGKKKNELEMRANCIEVLKSLDSALSQQVISDADKAGIEDKLIMVSCLIAANTREKRTKALKVMGLVAAGVIAAASAILLLLLIDSDENQSDGESDEADGDDDDQDYYIPEDERFNPYYEPFADPNNPLYIEPSEESEDDYDEYDDDDVDYSPWDDYIDGRPWGYDNEGY